MKWASFHPITTQAVLMGAFTAMSIASSQYFLTQINHQLTKINLNLDKILEFLYGDKRAELLAEVDFTQYVYENYNSIMNHEDQRVSAICGLQQAKKVAMKDMEFYMMDLDSHVGKKDNSNLPELLKKALQMKESVEVSIQLYVIGGLMEMYCSQNYDSDYIQYIENRMTFCIEKYEKRLQGTLGKLCEFLEQNKGRVRKNDLPDFEKNFKWLNKFVDSGKESVLRKTLQSVLRSTTQVKEFYITKDGDVYCQTQNK